MRASLFLLTSLLAAPSAAQLQPNGPASALTIHGRAGDGFEGRQPMEIVSGAAVPVRVSGGASRRLVLMAGGAAEPGLATTAGTLQLRNPVTLLDGFAGGPAALLATTGPSAASTWTFGLALPLGQRLAFQAAVEDASGSLLLGAPQELRSAFARLVYTRSVGSGEETIQGTNPFGGGDVPMTWQSVQSIQEPTFSPDGSQLAYVARLAAPLSALPVVHVTEAAGTSVARHHEVAGLAPGTGMPSDLAWSSSGAWLSFRIPFSSGSPAGLVVANARTGASRVVPSTLGASTRSSAWSSSGDVLLYTFFQGGVPTAGLYDPTTGSDASVGAIGTLLPSWRPGGPQIALPTPTRGLSLLDSRDGTEVFVSDDVKAFAWSPTGSRLAYVTGGFATAVLHTVLPDGSDDVALHPSGLQASQITWSPCGRFVAYSAHGTPSTGSHLHVTAAIGPAAGTYDLGPILGPALLWSPSGQYILFVPDVAELRAARFDGSDATMVNGNGDQLFSVQHYAWSPRAGDERIAYVADEESSVPNPELHLVDADGSGHVLVSSTVSIPPLFDPSGRWILFERLAGLQGELVLHDRLEGSLRVVTTGAREYSWSPVPTGTDDRPARAALGGRRGGPLPQAR